MPIAGENELFALSKDPQVMMRAPLGAMSPLWVLFAGAAVSGAAWWWMTRWARPANIEALFGAAEANLETQTALVAKAVEEASTAIEPVVEAAAEAVAAAPALAEPAIKEVLPAAGDLIEAAPEPVGGESAPISPVLEALAPEGAQPSVEPPARVETAAEHPAKAAPAYKPAPKTKKAAPPPAD
jgi:hypothetical protein